MDNLMTRQLDLILRGGGVDYEPEFELEVNPSFLDTKGKTWLTEIYEDLGGQGGLPLLQKLKFDFKIKRNLIIWDDELHFNRYRLISLRSDLYSDFNFQFTEGVKRVCRTFEKECLKAGLQERIWNGSPFAKSSFGKASEPADFTLNGSPGWKLTAYNDAQMDLQSRIHGYKIFRLYPYETLMTGGSLKRLDQLLINPKEEQQMMIFNWLMRKLDS
jgi:hypothetical protein